MIPTRIRSLLILPLFALGLLLPSCHQDESKLVQALRGEWERQFADGTREVMLIEEETIQVSLEDESSYSAFYRVRRVNEGERQLDVMIRSRAFNNSQGDELYTLVFDEELKSIRGSRRWRQGKEMPALWILQAIE
jgi:hypothetical protein